MKFLVALGFFASAMALASPVGKSNNKQDGVSMSDSQVDLQDISTGTTRQEPEAVSLVKRVGSQVWFKIPINNAFSETELLISGVAVKYVMARNKLRQHGTSAAKYLCKSLLFGNKTAKDLLISILTDDNTLIDRVVIRPGYMKGISKLVEQYSGETVKPIITEIE